MPKKKKADKETSSEATDNEDDEKKCCNCCCTMEKLCELFGCAKDLAEVAGVEIPAELETAMDVAEQAQGIMEELPVEEMMENTKDIIKEHQKTRENKKKLPSGNPKQSTQ